MKIIIVGPRSVGKSTISRLLAKKLKMKYYESDALMDTYLKRYGGLDRVIKSGKMNQYISKSPTLVEKVLKKNNFVLDLAGGAISSRRYKREADKIIKLLKKYKPLIIGLLPYRNNKKSITHLFKREQKREHFKNEDKKELLKKTKKDYIKVKRKLNEIADNKIYTKNNKPEMIIKDIIKIDKIK